ncbi:MAG TPA: YCF48-related protein [Cyclobacteriaceae bacterium]|nr:YCF48-related protein [Cyclobacteriaceae bacterium]
MKIFLNSFKVCVFFIIYLQTSVSYSQWTSTGGPVGGNISSIYSREGRLLCGSINAGLWVFENHQWNRLAGTEWMTPFSMANHGDTIIVGVNDGVMFVYDDLSYIVRPVPEYFVYSVASNGKSLYAGTLKGLFRSDDHGKSWNDINDDSTRVQIKTLAVTGDTLFASNEPYGENTVRIFRSFDGGQSWSVIGAGLDIGYRISSINIYENKVFITASKCYRSEDFGNSWQDISVTLPESYYADLKIKNDTAWLLPSSASDIYTSLNFGNSWEKRDAVNLSGTGFSVIEESPESIFIGSSGLGIFRGSKNQSEWEEFNNDLVTTVVYDIISRDDTVYAGTEDSKISFSNNVAGSASWNVLGNAPNTSRSLTVSGSYIFASGSSDLVYRSTIPAGAWEFFRIDPELSSFVYVEELNSNEDFLFAATWNGMYRSADQGDTWERLGLHQLMQNSNEVRNVRTLGPNILVGTWEGVFMSSDNGDHWENISSNLPDSTINTVAFLDTVIFAGTNKGILRSADRGITWIQLSYDYCSILGIRNQIIFAGGKDGKIMLSDDSGDTWKSINEGLPSMSYLRSIGFTNDYLMTGFQQPGQGVWKRPLYDLVAPTATFSTELGGNEFLIGSPITISFDQEIRNSDGNIIADNDLQGIITVRLAQDSLQAAFDASISVDNRSIAVLVHDPLEEMEYMITLQPVANLRNLLTDTITIENLRAVPNYPPILSDIDATTEYHRELDIHFNILENVFHDENGDDMALLRIDTLPVNGLLYNDGNEITPGQEIPFTANGKLTYVPGDEYLGTDYFIWNASDGLVFASSPARVNISVVVPTDLNNHEISPEVLLIYPNPADDYFNIKATGVIQYPLCLSLVNFLGQQVLSRLVTDESQSVTIGNLHPALYLLRINRSDGSLAYSGLIRKK